MAKKSNHAESFQPSTGLEPKNINQIQRYLDAVRTNLLFAKGVLLVEGDAEEILIPTMIKQVYGVSLDELGISLINIRSTGFENVAQLFHDKRIRRKCSIITDLDDAICDTTKVEGDSKTIINYKNKVEKSKQRGLSRKSKLDSFVTGNIWLSVFYAKYTFEVDFILNGNNEEVIQTIEQVYSCNTTQIQTTKELKSQNVAVFGKRVLTMANQEGKGWFAIIMGKYINSKTYIPEYIIDAIIFAKNVFSREIIADISEFRIKKNIENNRDNEIDFSSCIEKIKLYREDKYKLKDLILEIETFIPKDQLLTLLKKL